MYIPTAFKMNEKSDIYKFIDRFNFGILFSSNLEATHLPFVVQKENDGNFSLICHCAKANKHYQQLENSEVMAVFSGPHAYISPTWYAQQPAVPTWNYSAVHAYGKATLLNSVDTLAAVHKIVEKHESELLNSPVESVMSAQYVDKLLAAIQGIKITVTRLEGKQKLGQNRKRMDQAGVYGALQSSNGIQSRALAQYMEMTKVGIGI